MKKNLLPAAICILELLFFTNLTSAQQSNLNEDYTTYLPEVRAINKQLAQAPQNGTILTKEGLAQNRKMMESISFGKPQLQPFIKNIKGPEGDLALRIFKPDTIRGVVLDIHGGAWCTGTAQEDDFLNDQMARACKVAVVSVDYRLAPEAPFPACIEDCKA